MKLIVLLLENMMDVLEQLSRNELYNIDEPITESLGAARRSLRILLQAIWEYESDVK